MKKFKEYLEMAIDLAVTKDAGKIQAYKGSAAAGEAIEGASIAFAGNITGEKKEATVSGKPIVIYYLKTEAAKKLLNAVSVKYKLNPGVVDEFLNVHPIIPFTNGVVELDIAPNSIQLTGDISKIK